VLRRAPTSSAVRPLYSVSLPMLGRAGGGDDAYPLFSQVPRVFRPQHRRGGREGYLHRRQRGPQAVALLLHGPQTGDEFVPLRGQPPFSVGLVGLGGFLAGTRGGLEGCADVVPVGSVLAVGVFRGTQ
jgi:hypothetical protein